MENLEPPFQGEIGELDTDGVSVLFDVFNRMASKKNNIDTDVNSNEFIRLSEVECSRYFRKYTLIKKIVCKYPTEAKNIGYELKDEKGNTLETGDEILLEAFKEASIFSRLYSKCFLKLIFENNFNEEKPVKIGDKLTGFEILHDLYKEGDFYTVDTNKVHYHRIIPFYGSKSYSKYMDADNVEYSDSVLQGLVESFEEFLSNNSNARFILRNLSYLTVGIDNLANKTNSREGENAIFNRMSSFSLNKSIYKTLTYDAQKEKIDFISQTITGVRDVIEASKDILVTNSDYPVEQIFEQSPGQKLGSGIQNQLVARYLWAKRCRAWVIDNWMPYYKIFFERTRDMSAFKIYIPFIVELTEDEKADIQNKGSERVERLINSGVIDANEARTGYLGDEYSLNIELTDKPDLKTNSSVQTGDEPKQTEKNIQQDAIIPDNEFWDSFANITTQDLDEIANAILD